MKYVVAWKPRAGGSAAENEASAVRAWPGSAGQGRLLRNTQTESESRAFLGAQAQVKCAGVRRACRRGVPRSGQGPGGPHSSPSLTVCK